MPISDTPMTYLEFRAIRAQVLRELKLKPTDWIQLLATNIDSAGQTQEMLNTSGQVTEANSTNIMNYTSYTQLITTLLQGGGVLFTGSAITNNTIANLARKRVGLTGAITLAGGTIANHVLVSGIAGYQSCIRVKAIWGSAAQTYSFTFQDEDDAALSPPSPAINFGAFGAGEMKYGLEFEFQTTADNKDIEVDITGGAGADTLWIAYEYWYET